MQIMKSSTTTTTIWESASRPLFVRSVWLEAPKIGRSGPQRHFILDYEPRPRRRSAHSKSAAASSNSTRNKAAHATLQHSQSYDFVGDWCNHYNQCEFRESLPTDLLLIAPAKVEPLPAANTTTAQTSQQQQQKYTTKPSLPPAHRSAQKRPPTIFFRNRAPHHGPLHELYELYSHHSSLQELQSTLSQANSHADERLAERVLNWLDLAGKRADSHHPTPQQLDTEDMVKRPKKMTAPKASAAQPPRPSTSVATSNRASRPANVQAQNQSHSNSQSQSQLQSQTHMSPASSQSSARPPRKHLHYASATRAEQTTNNTTTNRMGQGNPVGQGRATASDAVKNITIIFDREGVPVRFNRPIRNIDLCTLSASPGTVRRLASSLTSARLYSGEVEQTSTANSPKAAKSLTTRHRSSNDVAHSAKSTGKQKQIVHDPSVFDAKKQLHIFMPNLPKKSLLNGCGSVDDTLSGLSNTFSELCKI